jgi:hypothetical protein
MQATNGFKTQYDFTDEDIALNRTGELSHRQLHKIRTADRKVALVIMAIVVPLIGIIFSVMVSFSQPFFTGSIGGLLPVIVLVALALPLALLFLFALRVLLFPVKTAATLKRISGVIVLGNRTSYRSSSYEVEISGKQFYVPDSVYQQIDSTKVYTLYYTNDHKIRALEEGESGRDAFMDSTLSQADTGKSPLDFEQEQLQRLFHFDPTELAMNRDGHLSPKQQARLYKDTGPMGCYLVTFIFTGLPALVIGLAPLMVWLRVASIAVGGVFFLLIAIAITNGTKDQRRKIAKGKIKTVTGPAVIHVDLEDRGNHHHSTYHISLGKKRFTVQQAEYFAFKEGREYQIHYLPGVDGTDGILSAEQISQT